MAALHRVRDTEALLQDLHFIGSRRSAAAEFRWIIAGRRVVVVGPQTTRNGVVAIDSPSTRRDVARDQSLAGTNDGLSRLGTMPSCGGVRRSKESDQDAQRQDRPHWTFSNHQPSARLAGRISRPHPPKLPSPVIARLAAFAKASAAERICGPGEALAETGPGDPVFQRQALLNREVSAYWITRVRG
jgi:hypothetical protein